MMALVTGLAKRFVLFACLLLEHFGSDKSLALRIEVYTPPLARVCFIYDLH